MQKFLSYLLPNFCALCARQSRDGICPACEADYFPYIANRCRKCALPLSDTKANTCGACLASTPDFDRTFVCCNYVAPIDNLVLGLKFGHQLRFAKPIAEFLEKSIHRNSTFLQGSTTLFCPVPLSRQRLSTRGFNQSLEIARSVTLPKDSILLADLIWRLKDTIQQSSLHPDDRNRNVRGAFFINPALRNHIQGKHIAIIDDVITTGATLNEIAKLMKQAGAKSVSNFVFARTIWH